MACVPFRAILIPLLFALGSLPQPGFPAQPNEGFGVCIPDSQRGSRDVGCFIKTERAQGKLGAGPIFWHVTKFASLREAEQARRPLDSVIEAYGDAWLMSLDEEAWRPASGQHVASIGPLPLRADIPYSALYMEASMKPGMKSAIHTHSGVEAWYTISGETCLETPQGATTGRADGPPVIIPAGVPMELTATGTRVRTSLVLILHAASEKPTTPERNWRPRGLCSLAR